MGQKGKHDVLLPVQSLGEVDKMEDAAPGVMIFIYLLYIYPKPTLGTVIASKGLAFLLVVLALLFLD